MSQLEGFQLYKPAKHSAGLLALPLVSLQRQVIPQHHTIQPGYHDSTLQPGTTEHQQQTQV